MCHCQCVFVWFCLYRHLSENSCFKSDSGLTLKKMKSSHKKEDGSESAEFRCELMKSDPSKDGPQHFRTEPGASK